MSDEAIHNERQKVYGDWRPNMAGTSLQIDGLRVQYEANNPGAPLPAWWAPLCLVVTKLNRIASGNYHEDNFVDLRVYLGFVEQMQQGVEIPAEPAYTPPDVKLSPEYELTGEYREPRGREPHISQDARGKIMVGFGEVAVINNFLPSGNGPRHIVREIGGAA